MKTIKTAYGLLKGVIGEAYDNQGNLRSCRLEEHSELITSVGKLIPRYKEIDVRTKYREAICFYPSGKLKSVYLEHQMIIETSLGLIEAELITFYETGSIHRIFPLYGQISGYWSEEEEYQLATCKSVTVGKVQLYNKISCYCFYPSGKVKSLTLWPKEVTSLNLAKDNYRLRIGIAFYEEGEVYSLEPAQPIMIQTEIGEIMAYHNEAMGIHGDRNSLVFNKEEQIQSLITTTTAIRIINKEGTMQEIKPELVRSFIDLDEWQLRAIKVEFEPDKVILTDAKGGIWTYEKEAYHFETRPIALGMLGCKGGCKSCGKCR